MKSQQIIETKRLGVIPIELLPLCIEYGSFYIYQSSEEFYIRAWYPKNNNDDQEIYKFFIKRDSIFYEWVANKINQLETKKISIRDEKMNCIKKLCVGLFMDKMDEVRKMDDEIKELRQDVENLLTIFAEKVLEVRKTYLAQQANG